MTAVENKIYKYMVALSRLYGIVDWKQFLKVYNAYNKPKITKKDIFGTEVYLDKATTCCAIYNTYLVSTLASQVEIDEAFHRANGKEYYTPTMEEIELLSRPKEYYQDTEAHKALLDCVTRFARKDNPIREVYEPLAKKVCAKIGLMIAKETKQGKIFNYVSKQINVERENDFRKLVDCIMVTWNSTRLWANRGFSPNEMAAIIKAKDNKKEQQPTIIKGEFKRNDFNNLTAIKFYKIWYHLLYWINNKYKITEPFPLFEYGKPVDDEKLLLVRKSLWKNAKKYIVDFLQSDQAQSFSEDEREILDRWATEYIESRFLVHQHFGEYSIFQEFGRQCSHQLYAVRGITNPLIEVVGDESLLLVDTVLLPFEGKIIYDSFIAPISIKVDKTIKSDFLKSYQDTLKKHGIKESL